MNCSLPYGILVLQALVVPTVALFVALIGFLQWRTAHQRAVLDLFERRIAIYDSIREVIDEIVRLGVVTNEAVRKFERAIDKVPFLFRNDVESYLYDLRKTMISHHALDGSGDESSTNAQDRHFKKIGRFYDEFGVLLRPYVRMHQKAPWF
ncbi:MAG: hypothetical protein ABR878_13380 [Roseiarcus sp.]|jgi:hypothetical protein